MNATGSHLSQATHAACGHALRWNGAASHLAQATRAGSGQALR